MNNNGGAPKVSGNMPKSLNAANQKGKERKDSNVQSKRDNLKGARRDGNSGSSSYSSLGDKRKRDDANNAEAISRAAEIASKTNNPYAKAIGTAITKADKFSKGRASKALGRLQTVINRMSGPAGWLGQAGTNMAVNGMHKFQGKPNSETDKKKIEEETGGEDGPSDTEGTYSSTISDKKIKYAFVAIVGGILLVTVFICVIFVPVILFIAKEPYQASSYNPSMEDVENAYNKAAKLSSNSSNSSESTTNISTNTSSSDTTSNVSSSNTSFVSVKKTGNSTIDKLNEIAIREAEAGTGPRKYWDWFGLEDNWCAMFVSWLFDQIGGLNKYFIMNGSAGPTARDPIKAGLGTWLEDECTDPTTVPKPGDVLHWKELFGEDRVDKYSSKHVGYVYAVDDTYIYTVEGNHDPDHVVFVKRERKDCNINGYYRPNY